jgi:hypothetical protein
MKSVWLFSFLILFFSDCKRKEQSVPSVIIPEEKMVEILTDIRLAEGSYKVLIENGVSANDYIDSSYRFIYQSHQITSKQMDTSMKYYSMNPDNMEKMLKKVSLRIEEIGKKKP